MSQNMMKIISDRQGITLAFPMLLMILLSCAVLVLDIGRAHVIRAQMQTIVDASALAGVTAAKVKYDSDFVVEQHSDPIWGTCTGSSTDEDGSVKSYDYACIVGYHNYIVVKQTYVRPHAVFIDEESKVEAKRRAEVVAEANSPNWEKYGATFDNYKSGVRLTAEENAFSGKKEGAQHFHTEMRVKERYGLLNLLGFKSTPIYTECNAEAILTMPGTPETRLGATEVHDLPLTESIEDIEKRLEDSPASMLTY